MISDWNKPPRPGERALAEDPAAADKQAGLVFIGRIETPWPTPDACPRNGRASDAICRIHVDPAYRPGLASVETCTHLYLLYWMHMARRDLIVQAPSFASEPHGCFALRSPIRPNPISLSVVERLDMTEDGFFARGLDCANGTPLLDIKPYFARTDSVGDAAVGWHQRALSGDA